MHILYTHCPNHMDFVGTVAEEVVCSAWDPSLPTKVAQQVL